MFEALGDLGVFAAQAIVVVIAFGAIVGIIASSRKNQRTEGTGKVQITNLGKKLHEQQHKLLIQINNKTAIKNLKKEQKQKNKIAKQNAKKKPLKQSPTTWVMDFKGDIKAAQTHALTHNITAVLQLANPRVDEVMIRLESAGGLVHAYGLAASQLKRLRDAKINCTICVDKVAASGGYMMACIANQIVAAPFALVGSIGVVAQVPNLHRLLQRWEVDIEQHTAGKHKRTLTTLGKNTAEGRRKFKQDIERTHKLFKEMVKENRPALNINRLATGEVWYGQEALQLKLVDKIGTSEAWLLERSTQQPVYLLTFKEKRSVGKRLQMGAAAVIDQVLLRVQQNDYEQQITHLR